MACFARILLVEDDPELGPITVDTLDMAGHTTRLAISVPAAYALLRAPHDFQVVLLDLQVGAERGEALIERLRYEHVHFPPIIIFSAQPVEELRQAARRIQARRILQKPSTLQQITDAIELAVA